MGTLGGKDAHEAGGPGRDAGNGCSELKGACGVPPLWCVITVEARGGPGGFTRRRAS